jgi:dolichyl-phosphate-mannose--protein O-mannosyl transferase
MQVHLVPDVTVGISIHDMLCTHTCENSKHAEATNRTSPGYIYICIYICIYIYIYIYMLPFMP